MSTIVVPTIAVLAPKAAPAGRLLLGHLPGRPLVTVIIPSYNQGRFIRATLESILQQDYRPLEILVIDGASTDETLDVLQSYGHVPEVMWFSEPDHGIVEAVNKGFARANGRILAIQSSDDCYLPGALSRVVSEFQRVADVGLVYGDTVMVDADGKETGRYRIGPYSLENLFLLKTWIPQPSAFFRRELLDVVGGWDDRIPYAPDTDLWIRMAFRTEVRKIDEYLSQRRIHDEQRDTQGHKIVRDYTRMIEHSADIRQASPKLRRAAKAGMYLMRIRYIHPRTDWHVAWNLLCAGLLSRRCLDVVQIANHLIYYPVRRRLLPLRNWLMGGRSGQCSSPSSGIFWMAKELTGVLVKDLWRYAIALNGPGCTRTDNPRWMWLCNRGERLMPNPSGQGVRCEWQWGNDLHACRVMPSLGGRLMRVTLASWPIRFSDVPVSSSGPKVSFLFAHQGQERLPQLRQVLQSAFAQRDVRVECIVADLSSESIAAHLPPGIDCLHVPTGHLSKGWYKAWAFNLAARRATGDVLVFQDGDVCMPERYGAELARTILSEGYDIASILRYLFYLDAPSTQTVYATKTIPPITPVQAFQNCKGGTIAAAPNAFFAIGGFDEGFVDWGGEDDEFFDRCGVKRHCRFGYLPFVHLDHPLQADWRGENNLNISHIMPWRLGLSVSERVPELVAREPGNSAGPTPPMSYKAMLQAGLLPEVSGVPVFRNERD